MQDVQNMPPPDTNSTERDNDFGNHSAIDIDLDNESIDKPNEPLPVPPDQKPMSPIEEPPNAEKVPIEENTDEPKQIV